MIHLSVLVDVGEFLLSSLNTTAFTLLLISQVVSLYMVSLAVLSLFHYLLLNLFVNAGFRSRVKYFSIVDPMQMAYYVCEILDAGLQGPLFMVNSCFVPTV